jgi:hypothetical protein
MASIRAETAGLRPPGHPFGRGFPSRAFGIYVRSACCCVPTVARYCSHIGRSAEIKVRVSPEEKAAIASHAASAGVGLSDFVRSRALAEAFPVEASPRASEPSPLAKSKGPRSVVPEGAPIAELPKIARRHWADD